MGSLLKTTMKATLALILVLCGIPFLRPDFVAFLVIGPVQVVAKSLGKALELATMMENAGAVNVPFPLLSLGKCCLPDALQANHFVKELVMPLDVVTDHVNT